MWLFSNNR